jgi:hypothetical protein
MNKKSVEGLPLQYLIIILIAVIVIGIVMDITGVVDLGISNGLNKISQISNDTLGNSTI